MIRQAACVLRRGAMVATRATVGSTAPVTRACMTRLAVTGLHQARCASTAVAKLSELGKLLHKEVAEEQHSMEEEDDAELERLRSVVEDKGFEVVSEEGAAYVTLKRTKGGETVTVKFHVQAEVEDEDEEEEEEEEEEGEHEGDDEDEEEEEEGGTAFQVEVTVEKDGKSLVFDCHAADDFYIQEVQFNPRGTPGSDDAHYNDIYRGPAFEELDETLQIAFHKYLDERGVGKDVAAFVCAHADAKEQEEYIRWLQTVRNFVN
ncbi:mitochondrial glycoprotein [Tribonema minus]|uniref:Mitochondrial glycoprotein n=1 Tax=Tribonema minus TaxID=303371 RepID=A0A835ZFZ3_9STRA|nr:mitochondrial glycoprotein [Tribonema minus]